MSRWVRKVPLLPRQDVPLRVAAGDSAEGHDCDLPGEVDAGPRSVWECDCGRRWRIAAPYWRQLNPSDATASDVPEWVLSMGDPDEEVTPH